MSFITFSRVGVADDDFVLGVRLAGDFGRLRELARGADQLTGGQRGNNLLPEGQSRRGGAQQRWITHGIRLE